MDEHQILRAKSLIKDTVKKLELDLTGLTVLTEVGSNYYLLTPIIAHYAGAAGINAWVKNSVYGDSKDIVDDFNRVIQVMEIPSYRFKISQNSFINDDVASADIVTNLGHIRPINKNFIDLMKSEAVISLMSEKWELRESDIDISYCKSKSIKVAGVSESHPEFNVFNYVGLLAMKMVFEAGYEIVGNKILIISNDAFGDVIKKRFELNGAHCKLIANAKESDEASTEKFDFVFLCDYLQNDLDLTNYLIKLNSDVIHLCGNLDYHKLKAFNIKIYPSKTGTSHRMTFAMDNLGITPLVKLHALGLKVGESVFRSKKFKLSQLL